MSRFEWTRLFPGVTVESLVTLAVGAVLARGGLLNFAWPFGLAYYGVTAFRSSSQAVVAALGVVLGRLSLGGITEALVMLPQLIFVGIAVAKLSYSTSDPLRAVPVALALVGAASGVVVRAILGSLDVGLLPVVFESAIAACLSVPFAIAMPKLLSREPLKGLNIGEALGAVLLAAGGAAGLSDVVIYGISAPVVFSGVIVILAASRGGAVAGSVAGTILGAILSMTGTAAFPLAGALAAGGLVSGVLKGYGKIYAACAFFLAAGVFSHEIPNAANVMPFIVALASSSVVFLLMPRKLLWRLPALEFKAVDNAELHSISRGERAAEIASHKLEQIRNIFDDLSRDLAAVPDLAGLSERARLVSLFNDITRRRCSRCTAYLTCWRDNFHRTYRDILDLVALAELKGGVTIHDVQASIGGRCVEGSGLTQAINDSLSSVTGLAGSREFYEGRRAASHQLKGIADIMKGLVTELSATAHFDSEKEARLRRELLRAGLPVRDLSFVYHLGGRYEVVIEKDGCGGLDECRKAIVPVMSSLLGEKVTIARAGCAVAEGKASCSIKLVPATRLKVRAFKVGLPRFGGSISGDTSLVSELEGGRSLLVISDGMGSGQEAALQSKAAVSMLRRLVEAGFGHEFAARTTNSLLLLRSPGETFATVDSVLVDLYSGQAEFIKIGSSPSFIKRRRTIQVIRSRSLPAGILAPADIERVAVGLKPGDLVIMMSDGILESRKSGTDREEWLARFLRKLDSDDPQEVAELLVDEARKGTNGGFSDDLTLIVARVDLYTDATGDIFRNGRWDRGLAGASGRWNDSQFETYSQAGWFA